MKSALIEYLEEKHWELTCIYSNNTMVFTHPSIPEWDYEILYNLDSNKMKVVHIYSPNEDSIKIMGYKPRKETLFDGRVRSLEDYISLERMLF